MVPSRILVTGTSGFLGCHLLPQLRAAWPAATLIAASRGGKTGIAASRHGEMGIADQGVALDLLHTAGMEAMLRAIRPDAVVHLAALASVGGSFHEPGQVWRVNVDGTRALADILLRHLPETVLILASSAEVYGMAFQTGAPVGEDAAMLPANPYAAAKAAADLALGEMALRGLRLIRLRLFNQIGPGQSESYAVAAFSRQIARAEAGLAPAVLRVGALDRWRDFLDVRDGCAAFVAALRHAESLPAGVAINVASGISRRMGDILDSLRARSSMSFILETEAARMRPTDVEHVRADVTRAHQMLRWNVSREWNETLDAILADWRARAAAAA